MCYLCHCGDYLGHLWRQAGKLMDIFIADWMHEKPSKPTAQTLSWPTFTYISLIEHFRSMKSHNEISFIYIPLSVRIRIYLYMFAQNVSANICFCVFIEWQTTFFLLASFIWSDDSHFVGISIYGPNNGRCSALLSNKSYKTLNVLKKINWNIKSFYYISLPKELCFTNVIIIHILYILKYVHIKF